MARFGDTLHLETDALTLTCPVDRFDPMAPNITLKHSGARVNPAWQPREYVPAVTGIAFATNLEIWPSQIRRCRPATSGLAARPSTRCAVR